jgi:hypothetical protein
MQLHEFDNVVSMRRLLLLAVFLGFSYGALSPAAANDRQLMADAGNAKKKEDPLTYMRKKYPGCERELMQLCIRSAGVPMPTFCKGTKGLNFKGLTTKDVDSICAK